MSEDNDTPKEETHRPEPPRIENPLAKAPPKRIPALVTPEMVKPQNRTLGMKIRKILFTNTLSTAGEFAIQDVLFPSIRGTILDFGHSILENMFGGGRYPSRGRATTTREFFDARPQTNYRERSMRGSGADRDRNAMNDRLGFRRRLDDFRLVTITSRLDAERVLDYLTDCCERYGYVSVGDYYDALGQRPSNTDYNWGWYSLRRVDVVPSRDGGWMIDMPSAEPIREKS